MDGFNINQFFRKALRAGLRRHFERYGALTTFEWSLLKPKDVRPLVRAFEDLDQGTQARMLDEFVQITSLATPSGKVQILDEATFWGKQQLVAAHLEKLTGLYECAYWTLFEHPDCWKGAVRFAESDGKARRSWRKRANMPRLGRAPTPVDGRALAEAITQLFRQKEGRGEHCEVEQFRRGDKEYYFAYAQDHRQTSLEYAGGRMTNRPHRPAFEIIFIHDDVQRTLTIWHQGRKDRIQGLQMEFARAVLGRVIPAEDPRDPRIYDLNQFLDSDFLFRPRPELGIARAAVREIMVRVSGPEPCKLSIVLGATASDDVLHRRLQTMLHDIRPSLLQVERVRTHVEFERNAEGGRLEPCTFELRTPNSCNLKDDARGFLIQRMLEEHGVELRQPTEETVDVARLL